MRVIVSKIITGTRLIMKLTTVLITILLALGGAAFASESDSEEAPAEEIGKAGAPIRNLYDTFLVSTDNNKVVSLEAAADDLATYDVVFFGEAHAHAGNHLAQMRMFQALYDRNPEITLSLEHFERDVQGVVDQYLAGEIGEKVLQKDGRGWDNYKSSYRPLVEFAKEHELPVIASEAPKSAVICVGRKGPEVIDEIPQPDRSWIAAEIHVEEGAYMDKYKKFIGESSTHGGSSKKAGKGEDEQEEAAPDPQMAAIMEKMTMKSFTAQVVRDDTMAESIALHLKDNPGRKVIHMNGTFHSASHLGTPERLKMRMPELKIAVISPVEVQDTAAPGWTAEDAETGDYLLLIQPIPEAFVSEERELEWQMEIMKKRGENVCPYGDEEPAEKMDMMSMDNDEQGGDPETKRGDNNEI